MSLCMYVCMYSMYEFMFGCKKMYVCMNRKWQFHTYIHTYIQSLHIVTLLCQMPTKNVTVSHLWKAHTYIHTYHTYILTNRHYFHGPASLHNQRERTRARRRRRLVRLGERHKNKEIFLQYQPWWWWWWW